LLSKKPGAHKVPAFNAAITTMLRLQSDVETQRIASITFYTYTQAAKKRQVANWTGGTVARVTLQGPAAPVPGPGIDQASASTEDLLRALRPVLQDQQAKEIKHWFKNHTVTGVRVNLTTLKIEFEIKEDIDIRPRDAIIAQAIRKYLTSVIWMPPDRLGEISYTPPLGWPAAPITPQRRAVGQEPTENDQEWALSWVASVTINGPVDWAQVSTANLLKHLKQVFAGLPAATVAHHFQNQSGTNVSAVRVNTTLAHVEFKIDETGDMHTRLLQITAACYSFLKNYGGVVHSRHGAAKLIKPVGWKPTEQLPSGADWGMSWMVSVPILDPMPKTPGAPEPDLGKSGTVLYIIIGVITAVALIITVVLIISLNKKREDEYMPVDDLEDDRPLQDTY